MPKNTCTKTVAEGYRKGFPVPLVNTRKSSAATRMRRPKWTIEKLAADYDYIDVRMLAVAAC